MTKFAEKATPKSLIAPVADIDTAAVVSAVYQSVAGYERAAVIAQCGPPGATHTLTIQLKQATDTSGTSAKNLGSAVVVTAVSTEALIGIAESFIEQMDVNNGFEFIGVSLKTNKGSAVTGNAALILDQPRYSN